MERPKPTKGKKVNLKFFPESGNLIQGIESQIAFEATDAYGNPITLSGTVINDEKQETAHFTAIHDGRGVFNFDLGIPVGLMASDHGFYPCV